CNLSRRSPRHELYDCRDCPGKKRVPDAHVWRWVLVYLTRHQECRMMPRRHQTIACAKTGSCALSPFSVAYTTSISGRQRMLTELLRMTVCVLPGVVRRRRPAIFVHGSDIVPFCVSAFWPAVIFT